MIANNDRFESVNEAPGFDHGPGKFRIGLVTLSNDYVTERDFMNMRPDDDVAIYTSRLLNTPQCTVETLQAMAPKITEAAKLMISNLEEPLSIGELADYVGISKRQLEPGTALIS